MLSTTAPAAASDTAAVKAVLVDAPTRIGSLRSLSASEVTLAAPETVRIPVADVIELSFAGRPPQSASQGSLIELANGDRIFAGLSSMNDDALVALWKSFPDWPPIRIPAETIAGVLIAVPESNLERSRAFAGLVSRREKTDVVWLSNGDRVTGELKGFDQTTIKLAQGGKVLPIELSRVRGLAMNSALTSLPQSKTPRVQVVLIDGSKLTGWGPTWEPGGPLRLTTAIGATLEAPLAAVSSIRFFDGRATWLSDLEPEHAEADGFWSAATPAFAKDRNIASGPLVVRGREFAKGLGTRSQSTIRYDLGGRYRRFESQAAIDDLAEGNGSVRFAVEVDGARVFRSPLVTGRSEPLRVGPIDLAGKHRLTLIVEYGELADVNDWADWCDCRLTR